MKLSGKKLLTGLVVMTLVVSAHAASRPVSSGWAYYHSDPGGSHYSPLDQINTRNVSKLVPVWRSDAGMGGLQTTPLVIDRTLYAYRTDQQVIALDAVTGAARWTFDAGTPSGQPARGLTWWSEGSERRLFAGVKDALYALDPDTGKPIASFGDGGKVDLRKGLSEDGKDQQVYLTSPGVIYGDLIITGFRTAENKPAAPGAIRAYDVRTGKLRWIFHTIPRPGEPGHESWPADVWQTAGGANNWAGMVVDAKRGIVFAPTGSAVDDFFGGDRKGDNRYANSLLALDAATGKLLWHFQAVHQDIWDRDFPSPPTLVTVRQRGKTIDAVAQTSKQGFVFVFDRVSGKPLFPITERPFPASTITEESASLTQPAPVAPAPFARQRLTIDMLTDRTPEAHAAALKAFGEMTSDGQFVPLQLDKQTVMFPGFDGGAEWGGAAVDPDGILYVNSNDVAWSGALARYDPSKSYSPGASVYEAACAACHGPDRKGSPPDFPSLIGIGKRITEKEIIDLLVAGRGRMPAIPLPEEYRKPVIDFLLNEGASAEVSNRSEVQGKANPDDGAPYRFTGYRKFLDIDGYPAVKPPWGTLNAINLNTGQYLWTVPLGEYPELAAKGLRDTGSENYGGPIVTAGGLLIIAATNADRQIRAFDRRSGKLLWRADLPFSGNATPITYMIDGRQYVVIATSGGRNSKGPQGSAYVAFALPIIGT
jgi:quinoprotein glucose dehydrogenase